MISSLSFRLMANHSSATQSSASAVAVEEDYECPGERGAPTLLRVDIERAYALADRVLALDQPWRSRFIDYIALRAGPALAADQRPSRSQLALWLTSQRMYRLVLVLLRAWDRGT